MPSSSSLIELSLGAFTDRVAGKGPVPASGCVAALQGALGCALFSMAFEHAAGEGGSGNSAYVEGRAQELAILSQRLLELVDLDAKAYESFVEAEGDARDKAAREALEVPLEVAETALAGMRLAAVGAKDVKEPLWSECTVGLGALEACIRGGLGLVRTNAPSIDDQAWVEDRLAILQDLESQMTRLVQEIHSAKPE